MLTKWLLPVAAIVLVTICAVAQPVSAGHTAIVYDSINTVLFSEILSEMGIDCNIERTPSGRPYISFRHQDVKTVAFLYDQIEDTDSYESLLLYASWSLNTADKPSLSVINEWNSDNRWVRLYLDSVNDPCVDMDLLLNGGVTLSNIKNVINRFVTVANVFKGELLGN